MSGPKDNKICLPFKCQCLFSQTDCYGIVNVKWWDIFCFSIAFSYSFILKDINASQNFCHSPRKMMGILQLDKVSLLQTEREKRRDMKQQQGEWGSPSPTCSILLLLVFVGPDHWLLEKLESLMGTHKFSQHSSVGTIWIPAR